MSNFNPATGTNDAIGTTLPAVSGAASPTGAAGRAETVTDVEQVEVTIEQKVTTMYQQLQSLAATVALHTGQIAALAGGTATNPPINQTLPTLSTNNPIVGVLITVNTGTWEPPASSYTFAWKWGGSSTVLSAASNYTPVNTDVGHTLTCTVDGDNAAGAAVLPVTTAPTATVAAAGTGTPPTFTAHSPGGVTVGTSYSYTFAASGTTPITFSITAGTVPTGLSLSPSTGVLAGIPTAAGTFTFTVTASNGVSPPATANCSIVVTGALTSYNSLIASLNPALWLKLNEASGTVAADSSGHGFNGTYSSSGVTYGVTNTAAGTGNDAHGVALTTGTISVPNHALFTNLTTTASTQWSALMWVELGSGFGSFPWLMGVGDGGTGAGSTGWQIFGNTTLAFKAGNTQTNELIPTALTSLALVGVVWNGTQCQIWENGANSFSESETLGATVTDTTSPLIIGPTLGIVNQVMIFPTALSSAQMTAIYNDYTTSSTPSAPVWGAVTPPSPVIGTAYSYQFTASEFPTSWAVQSGSIPAGLSFSTSTGLLSGTPTGSAATYTFVLRATNATGFTDSPSISMVTVATAGGTTNIPLAPNGPTSNGSGFTLVFADDFNGTNLDFNQWDTTRQPGQEFSGGFQTWESQTFDTAKVAVDGNSHCVLTCTNQVANGKNYASGLILSKGLNMSSFSAGSTGFLFSPSHGGPFYIEAKIKTPGDAPNSNGTVFPAYWAVTGFNYSSGASGYTREMDFFEYGLQPRPGQRDQIDSTQLFPPGGYGAGNTGGTGGNTQFNLQVPFDPAAGFHTYTVKVNTNGDFSLWIDGGHIWDMTGGNWPAIDWMGLILNYSLIPAVSATFTDHYTIDYVCVWQDANNATGSAGFVGGGLAAGTVHP